jgi:hypothetical protein
MNDDPAAVVKFRENSEFSWKDVGTVLMDGNKEDIQN